MHRRRRGADHRAGDRQPYQVRGENPRVQGRNRVRQGRRRTEADPSDGQEQGRSGGGKYVSEEQDHLCHPQGKRRRDDQGLQARGVPFSHLDVQDREIEEGELAGCREKGRSCHNEAFPSRREQGKPER